jgi:SAM-dependent methyltransferase
MHQTLTEDQELKARHRAMWAWGDYPRIADEVIAPLGPRLVAATGIGAGQHVLDVAAGAGNAAIPAALTGASVVASDLTPELLDAGRQLAEARGASLAWQVADAESLPFGDADFDAVISCVGVMFAPHHQLAADELARVCRPGGRIGLLSWTPAGFIGEMFAVMKPYAPPPPAGAQPPPLWGDRDHVIGLLGDRVRDLELRTETLTVDSFASPEAFREGFKSWYGPTIGVYKAIASDPDKVAALDHELADLARRHWQPDATMAWEYLLVTATRT